MATLGERIREYRIKKGYTQDEIAELLGMTRGNFASYEQDRNIPPSNILSKIADFLNVSVDFLLGRSSAPFEVFSIKREGLSGDEQKLLDMFLARSEEMLREKGNLSEEKLRQVLRFMQFTFEEDLLDEKAKRK